MACAALLLCYKTQYAVSCSARSEGMYMFEKDRAILVTTLELSMVNSTFMERILTDSTR